MARTSTPRGSRDLLRFDRSDRWGLVLVLVLVVVATAVTSVVVPLVRWAAGDPVPLPFLSEVEVPRLDAVGTGHGPAEYEVMLADPTTGQRLLDLAPGVLTVLLWAAGAALVLSVMRSLALGDPFGPGTVRRLRGLALLLLLGPVVVFSVGLPIQGALLGTVDLGGLDVAVPLDLPWTPFVGGLVVAMLAEAFVAGGRLREDVEGLV